MHKCPQISWSDIAGLQSLKKEIYETIIRPLVEPNISDCPKNLLQGLLLFGAPGTGKIMLGTAIAKELNFTLFLIKPNSISSEFATESERFIKALFILAKIHQPSVIFFTDIDILFPKDNEEIEFVKILKTEFLRLFDQAQTSGDIKILIIASATRPEDLDDTLRAKFTKELYVSPPDTQGRAELIKILIEKDSLEGNKYDLSSENIQKIAEVTEGYQIENLKGLCAEAFMVSLDELRETGEEITPETLRGVNLNDFLEATKQVIKNFYCIENDRLRSVISHFKI